MPLWLPYYGGPVFETEKLDRVATSSGLCFSASQTVALDEA